MKKILKIEDLKKGKCFTFISSFSFFFQILKFKNNTSQKKLI